MRTYASSGGKRKSFCRKSELWMFLLICGGYIGAPNLYTNMACPDKDLQRCVKCFGKLLRNCRPQRPETWTNNFVYILVFYNISFSWLLPLDGLQFIFLLHDRHENNLYRFYFFCFSLFFTLVISSGALISRSLSVSFKLRQKTGICLGCDCLKSRALLSDSFLELATLAMMLHP